MPVHVRIDEQVEHLGQGPWNAFLGPGRGVLQIGLLGPCQSSLPGLSWRLLTARTAGTLVGLSAGYVQRTPLASLAPRVLATPLARLRPLTVLELGPPVCPGAPAVVSEPAAWWQLLDTAIARVEEERLDLLAVRDLAGPGRSEHEEALVERGFSTVTSRDTWVLALPFASFDAYLAALRSDYRRRAQASLALPMRASILRDFRGQAPALARLVELTAGRSRASRAESIDAGVLAAWAGAPGTAAVLLEDPRGTLLAVAVVLSDGPVVHFLRCGFDAAVGRATGAYVRLLFELVRFSIEEGARALDLGVTTREPKQRLGAQAVPLRVWARPRQAALRGALRLVAPALGAPRELPPRRVFRSPTAPVTPWWYHPLRGTGAGETS